jgi:hypothetical protein
MDDCLLWVFVLSGRGLCDGPIPRPEESYRLWYASECDHVKINNLDTYCEWVEEVRTAKWNCFKILTFTLCEVFTRGLTFSRLKILTYEYKNVFGPRRFSKLAVTYTRNIHTWSCGFRFQDSLGNDTRLYIHLNGYSSFANYCTPVKQQIN